MEQFTNETAGQGVARLTATNTGKNYTGLSLSKSNWRQLLKANHSFLVKFKRTNRECSDLTVLMNEFLRRTRELRVSDSVWTGAKFVVPSRAGLSFS